jgi:hypothetical protein
MRVYPSSYILVYGDCVWIGGPGGGTRVRAKSMVVEDGGRYVASTTRLGPAGGRLLPY